MNGRIRVGVIGLGRIGRLRMDLAVRRSDMEVVAACDTEQARHPRRSGCRFFKDPERLLAQELEAVFVCTPNRYTPGLIVKALDRGLHVFSEKPPGRDLADVRAIQAAEKRNPSLKLKFGFNHRYHEGVRQAKAVIDGGGLGRILWMRGVYGKSGGSGFDKGWRSDRRISGGGILLDQGIHMLDLFHMFCGRFEEVHSFVSNSYWGLNVEDNAFALLRNRARQVAMLHSSSTHWRHTFLLEIYLTEGYVAVKGILTNSRTYGRETLVTARRQFEGQKGSLAGSPREEVTYFDDDVSWEREMDEFAACVLEGKPVRVGTSSDALKAMDLVYRIYRADQEWWKGHVVDAGTPVVEKRVVLRRKRL